MPARKRNFLSREKDFLEIARMYCQGVPQSDIAKKLGLTQQQISYDLQSLRKEWQTQRTKHFDALLDKELVRLDTLEREAWQAWENSKRPKETRKIRTTTGTQSSDMNEIQQKETVGDPRFLTVVENCIQTRLRLLGLNAPQVKGVTGEITHRHVIDQASLETDARKKGLLELAARTGAFKVLKANTDEDVIDVVEVKDVVSNAEAN
jgi:hypothetical protein